MLITIACGTEAEVPSRDECGWCNTYCLILDQKWRRKSNFYCYYCYVNACVPDSLASICNHIVFQWHLNAILLLLLSKSCILDAFSKIEWKKKSKLRHSNELNSELLPKYNFSYTYLIMMWRKFCFLRYEKVVFFCLPCCFSWCARVHFGLGYVGLVCLIIQLIELLNWM